MLETPAVRYKPEILLFRLEAKPVSPEPCCPQSRFRPWNALVGNGSKRLHGQKRRIVGRRQGGHHVPAIGRLNDGLRRVPGPSLALPTDQAPDTFDHLIGGKG